MTFDKFIKILGFSKVNCKKIKEIFNNNIYNFYKIYSDLTKENADFEEIKNSLNDEDGFIMLTTYLYKAFSLSKTYKSLNIDQDIYFDTFKCFNRFLLETKKATKKYIFDRYWWTYRQTEMLEFRIGELEYEISHNTKEIYIHVPSDAKLIQKDIIKSIQDAKEFFLNKFNINYKFCLNSWLLSPKLNNILKKDSHIKEFMNLFDIKDVNNDSDDCIFWVFNTYSEDINSYKENTSLQKYIKNILLNGEHLGSAYGILKGDII